MKAGYGWLLAALIGLSLTQPFWGSRRMTRASRLPLWMLAGALLGAGFFLLMFWATADQEAQAEAGTAGLWRLPDGYSVWNWNNMIFGLPWVVAGLVLGLAAWVLARLVAAILWKVQAARVPKTPGPERP